VARSRPTLQDLGRAAGVSVFTASRAMRGGEGVAPATIARVRRAAKEIGYVPNQVARALKGDQTRTIGVLTANTANRYYTTLLQAITVVARNNDYQVLTSDAVEDGEYRLSLEAAFVETMLRSRVSGVIVTYPMAEENLRILDEFGIPCVFVDTPSPAGYGWIPYVWTDNHAGGLLAGQHFAAHGYTRWLLLGHTRTWATRMGREQGFVEAAQRHGADVQVIEGGNSSPGGYQAMAAFLRARRGSDSSPDALFATNELLLHGAVTALAEQEFRIGLDLGVISFDDFDWAPLLDPPITVVDQRISSMGLEAAQLLISTLDAAPPRPEAQAREQGRSVVLPPHLIVRRSCGCTTARPTPSIPRPAPRSALGSDSPGRPGQGKPSIPNGGGGAR
jgi:LacI family transcriptional regulator